MNHAAELKALKARVAALEAQTPAAKEAKRQAEAAAERQRQREAADAGRRQQELHQANERQSTANWIAHEKAEKARRDANRGRFRDPTGIWRGPDGRQLPSTEAADAAATDLAWKKENQK